MNYRSLFHFLLLSLFVLMLPTVPRVHAHGDEPRLEISVERVSPGGVVDVRGVDFEPEESVSLALIGTGVDTDLGVITADVEGVFLHIVAIPAEMAEGKYAFRAITDDHEIHSPTLTVFGPPLSDEQSDGPRDQEEALLVAIPTSLPDTVSGATSQPAGPEIFQPADSPRPAGRGPHPAALSAGIVVGIALVFVLGRRLRSRG